MNVDAHEVAILIAAGRGRGSVQQGRIPPIWGGVAWFVAEMTSTMVCWWDPHWGHSRK